MYIPICFLCSRFNDDDFTCVAFPDGVPQVRLEEGNSKEEECANGIYFSERKDLNNKKKESNTIKDK